MTYGGEQISDKAFLTIVIHELIHTFGNHDWDARLDAPGSTWDKSIEATLYSAKLSQADAPMPTEVTHVMFAPVDGGSVNGGDKQEVLVGSTSADNFFPGQSGDAIYSGSGNDIINVKLGGGYDTILDDGGIDQLVLPVGAAMSNVAAMWSPDHHDISVWVANKLEAIVVGGHLRKYRMDQC